MIRLWLAVLRYFEPGPRCPWCRTRLPARGYCGDDCRRADGEDQAFA